MDEYESEEPPAKFPRSNSFPNLRDLTIGGYADSFIPHPRRRANNEVVPMVSHNFFYIILSLLLEYCFDGDCSIALNLFELIAITYIISFFVSK